ncbi:glycosyltransferase family 1 protein [Neobacillus drentensis]|uniref:glycosyltransferase family 1 protein n=1 Tax=Neobacillus drentensis TaxID=220684 RepID=UPI002FFF9FC8
MSKRILHVVGTLEKGGIQANLMNYYRNINRSNYQFDIVVHGKSDGFEEEFKALGGKVFYLPTIKKIGPIKYIQQFTNVINQNGPYAAVHSHLMYQSVFILYAAKLAGVNNRISHSHSTRVSGFIKRFKYIWQYFIKTNATLLLSCGEKAGEFLYGKSKYSILPNAIDIEKFEKNSSEKCIEMRNSLNIPSNSLVLGHIGRFTTVKNHHFLIDLLKQCIEKDLNVTLILVGDGPLKYEVEKHVSELKLTNSVYFMGLRDDIPCLLNLFDVFLLPSLYEGFPVVTVESQAAGVPALVSDSVSKEIDLGIGLVEFLPINEVEKWIEVIGNFQKKDIDRNEIKAVFKSRMFDIRASVKQLEFIYDGE